MESSMFVKILIVCEISFVSTAGLRMSYCGIVMEMKNEVVVNAVVWNIPFLVSSHCRSDLNLKNQTVFFFLSRWK
jgi:hypothetical protein